MVPEIDGDRAVVDAVNEAAGIELRLVGRADRGTSGGVILVALPDGRPGVITQFLGSVAEADRTAEVLAEVRRSGLPVPRHHLVVEIGADVLLNQERLPGTRRRPGNRAGVAMTALRRTRPDRARTGRNATVFDGSG